MVGYFITTVGAHGNEQMIKNYAEQQGKIEETLNTTYFDTALLAAPQFIHVRLGGEKKKGRARLSHRATGPSSAATRLR